jgi:glutamate--cysteine ligase
MLPFAFESGFGFERYVDYALNVPMYFVYRNGRYIDVAGKSFRDFMDGRIPELKGVEPQRSDWADHLTTLFPEARIKSYLEVRGADGGTWRRICGLPALWSGIFYDQTSLDAAWDLVKDWTAEERETLRAPSVRRSATPPCWNWRSGCWKSRRMAYARAPCSTRPVPAKTVSCSH